MAFATPSNNHPMPTMRSDDASSKEKYVDYIISKNDKLETECKKLNTKLSALQKESEMTQQTLEEEVEDLTKTRTYLQGFSKNQSELAESWKRVSKILERRRASNPRLISWMCFESMCFAMVISSVVSHFPDTVRLYSTIVAMCVYMELVRRHLSESWADTKEKDPELKTAFSDIDRIVRANTVVEDLIDNI
jgi:DNA repair exonuclease SbcCD ATPase subunit